MDRSSLYLRAKDLLVRNYRGILAVVVVVVTGVGWWREWSWGTWILIGASISAFGEFAPTTGRFAISPQISRKVVLLGVLITIVAGFANTNESETETRRLSQNVDRNLKLTEETLGKANASIDHQEEMMKTLTGADSIFYLHPEVDAIGDTMMYGRFVGSYPLPHVYFEILDFSGLGVGFMDAHKAGVVYTKTLSHVFKHIIWKDEFPKLANRDYGAVQINYEQGHRRFTQYIACDQNNFSYRIYEITDGGPVHLSQFDHGEPFTPDGMPAP